MSPGWFYLAAMIAAYGVANLLQSMAAARTSVHHTFDPQLLVRLACHRTYLLGLVCQVLGFVLAFGCAVTWAVYSVVSRRLGQWPTVGVTVYCAGTAALSVLAHLLLEETAWPESAGGWAAVAGLGLGPVGLAFFLWDVGVKRGDIQLLGVASYAAPLLSTLALVAAGEAEATWSLGLAALLIAGGAALAARPAAPKEGSAEA